MSDNFNILQENYYKQVFQFLVFSFFFGGGGGEKERGKKHVLFQVDQKLVCLCVLFIKIGAI